MFVRVVTVAWLAIGGGMMPFAQAETAAAVGVVAVEAPVSRFDRGLLWRIDRPHSVDATKPQPSPSHLYGTVHVDDSRATDFNPAVRGALTRSRVFLPELLPDAASAQAFSLATHLAPTQTLSSLTGADDFERIAERLSTHYGVPHALTAQLKPWAAYVYLSQPARPMGEIVDAALIRLAQQQGLAIRPLETVAQQIAAMDAVPVASQVALLVALARNHDDAMAEIDRLVELYLAQDLAGMRRLEESAVRDDPTLRGPMAEFIEQILDRRNERMLDTLLPQLDTGGAFAAIGALHLTGDQGLLARLVRLGWRVQRVD
ncbi:MAG: TraB/GumN family protein [Pseudomonadota bacterium]|nr:TraB/GumN family protein [Pseudomonadota bacterium]